MADNTRTDSGLKDEFENPPAGPIGLHRGKRSWIARLLPYIITLVVAVALALGTWLWMSGKGKEIFQGSPTSTTLSSTTTTKKTKKKAAAKKDDTKTSDKAASDTAASNNDAAASTSNNPPAQTQPAPDTTKTVIVYNGLTRRVANFAATKAATLKSAGYTNVSARNPNSKPAANVVWYKSEADKVTAQDVASKLGIGNVAQVSSIAADIAVMYVTQ